MANIHQIQRSYPILATLDAATGAAPITLAHFGAQSDPLQSDPNYVGMIGLLSNFRAIAYLSAESFAEVALPELNLADGDTDRMVKILDVQWGAPRLHAEILLSPDGTNWTAIALIAFLNAGGYPFSLVDMLPYLTSDVAREFPAGLRLGIRLIDVGYGLIKGGDKIVLDGNWVEEYSLKDAASSIGTVITPDLTSIEQDIISLQNAIASVAAEVGIIKADLADDPEISDINALSAKLDQILLELPAASGGAMRSESSTESTVTITTTSSQLIAADASGLRISVLITNTSATAAVFVRTGPDAASPTTHTFKLDPEHYVELATGEAIQAIASSGSVSCTVAEFLK